jgi:hypothetical protein
MLINQKNDSSADEESSQSSLTANNHLFSLPAETLSLICKYLNAQDTQALSLTSKRVRSIILRLYLDTPILLPLTRKIYHEIQLKITRTLVLNTHEYDPGWIRKVLEC